MAAKYFINEAFFAPVCSLCVKFVFLEQIKKNTWTAEQ